MNLIDNGVEKFISYEKVDDGEHFGFKIIYIDWYAKTCTKYVNSMSEVKLFQECRINWTE